jgi:hypothetical protein
MGTIYILEPVAYVYPFNTGVLITKDLTFRSYGGDLAMGDRLAFSVDGNCTQIDFSKPGAVVTFTRRQDMAHSTNKL